MWQQLAFVSGLLIGAIGGAVVTRYLVGHRITRLRVALGDLVRAVDNAPMPLGRVDAVEKAIKEAREVLDR